ncbi:unnamed protein product [Didymodactylos carnosus]|uniref:PNPLA domain-containing protein n=1 Tax=Didymodactylos carnosus TaxID=1234261 RepID=A0A8S2M8W2_9BILA|nr:unnamed protein product [Didymodactylos carnosus]CAF3944645.1 unnamed protein product [Didymodactylos carnosus]
MTFSPSSRVSTNRRCDNCGVSINQTSWFQCAICKEFDLCYLCKEQKIPLLADSNDKHKRFHESQKMEYNGNEHMKLVFYQPALTPDISKAKQQRLNRMMEAKKIKNDYEMFIVTNKLREMQLEEKNASPEEQQHEIEEVKRQLSQMIVDYHLQSSTKNIHILSLDGGGVRGYMPIKILRHAIETKFREKLDRNEIVFLQAQEMFSSQFDYFVGTSTGGFIAFCLAVNYSLLDLEHIYSRFGDYFVKTWTGPMLCAKYDPKYIHNEIDNIINKTELNGKKLSAATSTLYDLHNLLNPKCGANEHELAMHGNLLEFDDDDNDSNKMSNFKAREKMLIITSYNATTNSMTAFNTSYAPHWSYRIADVLKATMAAPTYFPPHPVHKWNKTENGEFHKDKNPEIFIDGGVFANDPELTALWAIRMQWKKMINYYLLAIGTGYYSEPISPSNRGGYIGWIFNNGLLINTLMEATRSLTETITNNLAKFGNVRRMKFNFEITKYMNLDDPLFITTFDQEWDELLKNGTMVDGQVLRDDDGKLVTDFDALMRFYDHYIYHEKQN